MLLCGVVVAVLTRLHCHALHFLCAMATLVESIFCWLCFTVLQKRGHTNLGTYRVGILCGIDVPGCGAH
jgi:hypothetical protein